MTGSAAITAMAAHGVTRATVPWKAEQSVVTINGARLAMSMIGPADGIPLIVLHGGRGFGTHDGVFATYTPLAGRYRVIGFDMRGHGWSEDVAPFTFAQMVADIETIRQTLCGGRRIVLLGGSFGGMIALTYAVAHPDALLALILRGTAPSWHHEAGALASFRARAARADGDGGDAGKAVHAHDRKRRGIPPDHVRTGADVRGRPQDTRLRQDPAPHGKDPLQCPRP
ncbi:alpha/beta fold hydrolase [Gluconacetobacter liquefaciens]|uniref:Proline iminopeptidase n=1 Tax=Gluconacetobacter liquefaciens TaxID=89584 RepID=A0A7W4PB73_GLULI|nr:alpha/beta fold hydrolase [Gluconacetobacter liquefaciens]